jgi:hypothetical protein
MVIYCKEMESVSFKKVASGLKSLVPIFYGIEACAKGPTLFIPILLLMGLGTRNVV